MWHVSIYHPLVAPSSQVLKSAAFGALAGVGDHKAGQWEEVGQAAFHLRRRLSADDLRELPLPHRTLVDMRRSLFVKGLIEETMHSHPDPATQRKISRVGLSELGLLHE